MEANKRVDSISRTIKASPEDIYRAFMYKEAIANWRAPAGMKCHIYEFEPWQGGRFKMAFEYTTKEHDAPGKTSEHSDAFTGQFKELVANKKIVELINFESDNPSFGGTMTITTHITKTDNGTRVGVDCENVPAGIKQADHLKGISQSLEQLAAFVE